MKNLITLNDLRIGQQWIEDPSLNDGEDFSFTILNIWEEEYHNDSITVKWRDTEEIQNWPSEEIVNIYINKGEYTCIEPKSQNFDTLYEKLSYEG